MKQVKYLATIGLRTGNITNKMTHHHAVLQIIRQRGHQDAVCIVKRIDPIDQILFAQMVMIPRTKTALGRIENVTLSTLDWLLKL